VLAAAPTAIHVDKTTQPRPPLSEFFPSHLAGRLAPSAGGTLFVFQSNAGGDSAESEGEEKTGDDNSAADECSRLDLSSELQYRIG